MTMPVSLRSLADRVEREEPSRELDAEIAVACQIIPEFDPTNFIVPVHYRVDERRGTGYAEAYWVMDDGTPFPVHSRSAPLYTTSIDAAETILPAHISYELTRSAAGDGAMRRARLWDWRRSPLMFDPTNEWKGETKTTPAAALCAAALRVLAMEAEDAA